MNIRLEQPKDYREVENLTREAFWNVYRPGCTEHYVLNQYRTNPDFIPELDFVMEEDGKIIGHIMFSKAELVLDDGTRKPSWTFGPISIHPDYKRKGYGLQLLNYALEKARELGVGFLCMEGNIEFYKHAGFDLASKKKIHYHAEPRDAEVPYFLAQELIPGWLNGIEATYCPPKGYFVAEEAPEAFEAYEATFPKKEKLRLPGQLGFCQSSEMPLIKGLIAQMADTLPVTFISSVDEEGFPWTKAMLSPRVREGVKVFYFTTNTSSMRVAQYRMNPKASIYFCDAEGFKGMMLRGTMEVLTDAKSKEMIWRDGDTEYYPGGVTDPDYCVLKFTAKDGRFYSDFNPRSFVIE